MEDKKKVLLADGALVLAAICWGGGFVAGDAAVMHFTTFVIMTVRFLMAALVIFLLFRRLVRRSGKAEMKSGAILGTILFIAQPLQVVALKYTTPSKQAFLIASYAVIVPFMSWFIFKKRPAVRTFLAGFMTMVGIAFISLGGSMSIGLGDGLSLMFAVLYSFMLVMTGIFVGRCEPISMSFYSFLTTGLLSLVTAVIFEDMPKEIPMQGAAALIYLAVITTGVAYTLQNVAQRYTSDTHTAILLSTESLFGFVFGVFLYGDPFTAKILIGGLIVFSAVLVSELQWKKKPKREVVKEESQMENTEEPTEVIAAGEEETLA